MRALRWGLMGLGLLCTGLAQAADNPDKVASAIAESWLGHDAGDLLTQWPIDSGFTTREDAQTHEMVYTFDFGIPAHDEHYQVVDGQSYGGGVVPDVTYVHTEVEHVDYQQHCEVSFYADASGRIARYSYNGVQCRPYVRRWGRPGH